MTMTNLALNVVAVRVLDGSTFYGRQLRVIANGHAFSDCRDIDGTFCEDCSHCGTRNAHAAPLVVRFTELEEVVLCLQADIRALEFDRRQTDGRVFSTQVYFRTLSLKHDLGSLFFFYFLPLAWS